MNIDLLTTVESGGCSAKMSAEELSRALKDLPKVVDSRLLVDIQTHDDAGVYKISDDIALIHTVDFFPPVCSDAYDFGQIGAANSLSDVYAMGGEAISALNIVMFPSKKMPLDILKEILRGGHDKVTQAQAVIVGGHTIDDDTIKYGLAVTGIINPHRIITNTGAHPGDMLVLTKPLGTGIIISAKKLNKTADENYLSAIDSMKQLNAAGARIMQRFNVKGATDITGFGLLGHAFKMACASNVTIEINSEDIPFLPGVYDLADDGCLPCGVFNNRRFIEGNVFISPTADFNKTMIASDAQTSGGLLISVPSQNAQALIKECRDSGYNYTRLVGRVKEKGESPLVII